MNDSLKIKILTTLVAILILLNAGLMGYLWIAPHDGRPDRARDGHGPGGLMIRDFHFTDAQQQHFEELRDQHHSTMIDIDSKNRALHDVLFKNLATAGDTSALADSLIGQILLLQKSKEKITFDHLAQVRQMCSPEQQKLFDGMIAKAMAAGHHEEGWAPPPR